MGIRGVFALLKKDILIFGFFLSREGGGRGFLGRFLADLGLQTITGTQQQKQEQMLD